MRRQATRFNVDKGTSGWWRQLVRRRRTRSALSLEREKRRDEETGASRPGVDYDAGGDREAGVVRSHTPIVKY